MTSLQKDVSDALQIGDIDKPAVTPNDAQVASAIDEPVTLTTPAAPTPETLRRSRGACSGIRAAGNHA